MSENSANDWNNSIIEEFRANGGKVGGPFEGATLLLLTTTGAKSGKPRVSPLAYTTDGDRLLIIASKAGAPTNPDWYHNLLAHPTATVEVGTEQFQVKATPVVEEPERSDLYAKMVAKAPGFAEYEQKTTRKIPVVLLEKVS
jgi:deazaflavin-dependent oxidoreductase (nitroreductase family)